MSTLPPQFSEALTYEAYLAQWETGIAQPVRGLDRVARRYFHYARYNWERQARVIAAYAPSEALKSVMADLDGPQRWLVLTEDWCADAAYSLPVIAAAAALRPDVTLRILARDAHLEVMDQYLTHGARAIPKLIGFDADGQECFQWGSKPAALAERRDALKSAGVDGSTLVNATIAWYEDESWLAVESELIELLKPFTGGRLAEVSARDQRA